LLCNLRKYKKIKLDEVIKDKRNTYSVQEDTTTHEGKETLKDLRKVMMSVHYNLIKVRDNTQPKKHTMAFKNMQYEKLLSKHPGKTDLNAALPIKEECEHIEEEEDHNEDVFMIDESIPFEYESLIKNILTEKNLIPKNMNEEMM
jgi:hypothetical protein